MPLHPVRLRNEGNRWRIPEGKTLKKVSWGNVYLTGLQGDVSRQARVRHPDGCDWGSPLWSCGEELQGHEAQSRTPRGGRRDRKVDDWTQAFPLEDAGAVRRTGPAETTGQTQSGQTACHCHQTVVEKNPGAVEADSRSCGTNSSVCSAHTCGATLNNLLASRWPVRSEKVSMQRMLLLTSCFMERT